MVLEDGAGHRDAGGRLGRPFAALLLLDAAGRGERVHVRLLRHDHGVAHRQQEEELLRQSALK